MTPRRPRESSPLPIHPLLLPEERLRSECRIEFLRRSGPGGQHRNKTETAVRITHQPTGITGEASERRSQSENREVAWNRLRLNLALRIRGEIPAYPIVEGTDGVFEGFAPSSQQNIPTNRTDPTEIWSRHLVGDKIRVSPKNPDYPILILHFLNQWEKNGKDWEKTATGLRTTKSQLLRLIDATSSAAGTVRKMERESRKVPSPFVKVLIGLGGNLGDREKNIETAWKRLGEFPSIHLLDLSPIIETTAAGGPSGQPDFLNAVGLLETTESPEALLDILQLVEKEGGRERHHHWGARTIDLDLLLYGDAIIRTDRLSVPHPFLPFRPFVLYPAIQVAPQMVHPIYQLTLEELCRLMEMNFRLFFR